MDKNHGKQHLVPAVRVQKIAFRCDMVHSSEQNFVRKYVFLLPETIRMARSSSVSADQRDMKDDNYSQTTMMMMMMMNLRVGEICLRMSQGIALPAIISSRLR